MKEVSNVFLYSKTEKAAEAAFKWVETKERMRVKTKTVSPILP